MLSLFKSIFGSSDSSNIKEILSQGAILIDVRSSNEFASGHANGAINIPLDQVDARITQIKSYNKPIVVCCASGMRSARAKSLMAGHGVTDVHDAGSWRNIR
ncbi:rhodanese-like domain-containing protein [Spirosoma fluviale]|uniref:Rhodanese-like domain-containing protein n=1 Tax=Spirosoma fluviale TaxID=1597977 RepID=A0A286GTH3_9BACT|nr:rhodanese-like domain-containing protein [Spirosoma fluviale]SOD98379.1 Rhodanese-like domain-containing protein [Spirosoma fluviale]